MRMNVRIPARGERSEGVLYRSTRKHRGALCTKCFHYRQISRTEEACDAYEKWLVYPQVKRIECEQYVSR